MDLAVDSSIVLDFEAQDEKSALLKVAQLLEGHPMVADFEKFWAAVWDRQCIQPPLLGNGIALPHARTPAVHGIIFAIGRCRKAVPFGEPGEPVKLIFLYGTPPGQVAESLAAVAMLAKKLHRPEILAGLLEADSETEFRKWLA